MTTREIPLPGGHIVLVDAEDYERVMEAGTWRADDKGGGRFYVDRGSHWTAKRGHRLLHRFLMDAAEGLLVDHLNGDTLDNRKENLRVVTREQNAANSTRRSDNSTGFKGVCRSGARFVAYVKEGYKSPTTGRTQGRDVWRRVFPTAEDAARARDAYVREHKDPATERFNFPLPGERGLDGQLIPLAPATEIFSAA